MNPKVKYGLWVSELQYKKEGGDLTTFPKWQGSVLLNDIKTLK